MSKNAETIKALTWNMSLDETGNLWIGGDGIKNEDNRADVDKLIDMGVIRVEYTMYGMSLYVNHGYEGFFR